MIAFYSCVYIKVLLDIHVRLFENTAIHYIIFIKKTKNGNLFQNIKIDKNLEKKFVSIPVEKGDLVIFSSFTIHRPPYSLRNIIRYHPAAQKMFNNIVTHIPLLHVKKKRILIYIKI